ncbi:endoglucanase 8-like [Musa troglodytarum]|uniref:Endoglucanase n=1 Tax=Musa troglodytarum TaxID=320322 RepID=A0A9E7ENB1_9LILI|nr:endoglucanase 8-like [Musa troglodytarum]
MAATRVRFCLALLMLVASMAAWMMPSAVAGKGPPPNYADALSKCLLFYEGQRSGKLPPTQRATWRKDSALKDGQDAGVDLVGGYYDAGDNVKFGFPLAFTGTLLAWSIVEFSADMGPELVHAHEALRWVTDYLMKATTQRNRVFVQAGDPYSDHNCWERPDDMDTPRPSFQVNDTHPGSEVAGETAAALAAASIAFRSSDPAYADNLLSRAKMVYDFASKYQGSYAKSVGKWVCPFYCDVGGYEDELVWGAAWLNRATDSSDYTKHITRGIQRIQRQMKLRVNGYDSQFSWENKDAGNYILLLLMQRKDDDYSKYAQNFACSLLPKSPYKSTEYTPGGLIHRAPMANMQVVTALSFLLVVYGRHLSEVNGVVTCGKSTFPPSALIDLAKSQVDYVLGDNPLQMSYMVGYGKKFPQRIHHRAASVPSIGQHPQHLGCKDGTPYYVTDAPNPNVLVGALAGGPNDGTDNYLDNRTWSNQSEPATYVNAPFVGVLAYFSKHG